MVSSYLKEQKGKKKEPLFKRYYLETCKQKKKYFPMSSTTHTKSNHNATKKLVLMNGCFYTKLLECIAAA